MSPELPKPTEKSELIIRSGSGLTLLSPGDSLALSEIINRSLAHIESTKAPVANERRAGEERGFEIAPGLSIMMCWIPPGEFLMGNSKAELGRRDDETLHRVKITKGYWLAKTQTTQAQWEAVMGNNPSHYRGENLPVEWVSWEDICGNGIVVSGFLGELNKLAPTGGLFHLPTEAQWEYACRAGTREAHYEEMNDIAWHDGNCAGKTHSVGRKTSNSWGLHDMLGNVWEWCSDWYGELPIGISTDPTGPLLGSGRVIRGGSGKLYKGYCRNSALFCSLSPSANSNFIGFRVALSFPYMPVGETKTQI